MPEVDDGEKAVYGSGLKCGVLIKAAPDVDRGENLHTIGLVGSLIRTKCISLPEFIFWRLARVLVHPTFVCSKLCPTSS